ncbi:hypothetical protein [Flavihumibacter sp. CACIAM 22H1]|uniref:hypothetical protein n=1 Tax=Flavihumibacter sp. CACIAM 22H1 TaxID=1812911 RepID=UPI0007A8D820|nr:hypothetical protein [Flavihumibacter sp. CACIAM 22H1]KYP14055.1 MAG: hypothetical protein A1D16_08895 [Flavihumibacter sp. CACIAM 22H1]
MQKLFILSLLGFFLPIVSLTQTVGKRSGNDLADSTSYVNLILPAICKGNKQVQLPLYLLEKTTVDRFKHNTSKVQQRKSLLNITGNVLYDMNYRSRIDTPYADREIYQHTIQTRLDITYKDRVPLKLYTTKRFSNSPLFRSYTDFNLQFNANDFVQLLKQWAIQAIEEVVRSNFSQIDSLKKILETKKERMNRHQLAMEKGSLDNEIQLEKERLYYKNKKAADMHVDITPVIELPAVELPQNKRKFTTQPNLAVSHFADSTRLQGMLSAISKRRNDLDSMKQEYHTLEMNYDKLVRSQQTAIKSLQQQVQGTASTDELAQLIRQHKLSDSLMSKRVKMLAALRNLSLGRSLADYSELTVKNISITGLQIEYNPGYYYAIAAGKVDYRFRDYLVPNRLRSTQYLGLVRFGKGTRTGNHIFLSYYTGRRQLFNSMVSVGQDSAVPSYMLAGLSLEGLWRINKNMALIGEVAKSTVPFYGRDSMAKSSWMNTLTDFSTRQNEAYSLRLNGFIPATQTKLMGSVRYFGSHFQSFSSFTTGSSQLRWMVKLDQPFFKRKLIIHSSIQQNEFNNPFVAANYKSSAVIGSIQANLRVKKWPFISVGYYPSYQLVKTDDDKFAESRYHTLSGSVGYHYNWKEIQLSSFLVYSQFYNNSLDSGFIYFNTRNILLTQTIQVNRLHYTLNAAANIGTDINVYSMEHLGQWTFSERFSIGAGIKAIKQVGVSSLFIGYSGNMGFRINKIGELQLSFDKGYLPGMARDLVKNNIGRITYYKQF